MNALTQPVKLVGIIAAAAIGGFFMIIMAITGVYPSGSPNVITEYQNTATTETKRIHTQGGASINWMDVYMYDYFRLQNDFSHISAAEILNSTRLFEGVPVRIPNPNYVPPTSATSGKTGGTSTTSKAQATFTDNTTSGAKRTSTKSTSKGSSTKSTGTKGTSTTPSTPTQPQYIYVTPILSLLDVMTKAGYTRDEYELALNIEVMLEGDGGGPVGDVTVPELRYTNINPNLLYQYVHDRDSLFTLSDIETIESAAQKYNVNPALLVAITGQEQGFVPVTTPDAEKIRNNPFNVFHSWQDYNTNLADAADVAANTLRHKLSVPPPQGEDAIQWANDPNNPWGIYAQDPHWAYGVEDIFQNIMVYVGQPVPSQVTLGKQ